MLSRNNIILYFILIFMIVGITFPIYWMFLTAFQPSSQALTYPPSFFFESFSFKKMIDVISDTGLLIWIFNSAVVAIGVVIFNL